MQHRRQNTPLLKVTYSIAVKDVWAEFRSKELLSAMLLFALLSILVFSFALELDRRARAEAISGVLWVTVAFAAILGLNRSMALEREQGCLEAMLTAPIPRSAIMYGKLAGNFAFALIVGLILLPVMTILYNISLISLPLVWVLAAGTLGLAIVGTLLSAMTAQTRSRETLLPLVMLPIALPIVIAAVRASTGLLSGADSEVWGAWAAILTAVDIVYFVACSLLFDFVIEE